MLNLCKATNDRFTCGAHTRSLEPFWGAVYLAVVASSCTGPLQCQPWPNYFTHDSRPGTSMQPNENHNQNAYAERLLAALESNIEHVFDII